MCNFWSPEGLFWTPRLVVWVRPQTYTGKRNPGCLKVVFCAAFGTVPREPQIVLFESYVISEMGEVCQERCKQNWEDILFIDVVSMLLLTRSTMQCHRPYVYLQTT